MAYAASENAAAAERVAEASAAARTLAGLPTPAAAPVTLGPARGSKRSAESEFQQGAEVPASVSRALEDIPSHKRAAEQAPEELKTQTENSAEPVELDELLSEWGALDMVEEERAVHRSELAHAQQCRTLA